MGSESKRFSKSVYAISNTIVRINFCPPPPYPPKENSTQLQRKHHPENTLLANGTWSNFVIYSYQSLCERNQNIINDSYSVECRDLSSECLHFGHDSRTSNIGCSHVAILAAKVGSLSRNYCIGKQTTAKIKQNLKKKTVQRTTKQSEKERRGTEAFNDRYCHHCTKTPFVRSLATFLQHDSHCLQAVCSSVDLSTTGLMAYRHKKPSRRNCSQSCYS